MKKKRIQQLLEFLRQEQTLSSEAAATFLGVSLATVRRDFQALTDLGMARRFHGGLALAEDRSDPALPIGLRQSLEMKCKIQLAALAATKLPLVGSMFIDGGTTTACLVPFLTNPHLRVITSSVAVLRKFSEMTGPHAALTMTGGEFNQTSEILLGMEALRTISNYHADWAVISGTTLDEDFIFDNRSDAADVQQCMAENADRLMVIADSSKLGKRALCKSIPVEKISILVTDFNPDKYPIVAALKRKGVIVLMPRNNFENQKISTDKNS